MPRKKPRTKLSILNYSFFVDIKIEYLGPNILGHAIYIDNTKTTGYSS